MTEDRIILVCMTLPLFTMSLARSDQGNGDRNTYYRPNPKLEGWIIRSVFPLDPNFKGFLGKTIVNKKPDPKPVMTESTLSSQKRKFDPCFPFGPSSDIDALIAKRKKKASIAQTSISSPNQESSQSNTGTASTISQTTQNTATSRRPLPNFTKLNPDLYNALSEEQKRVHDCIINSKQNVFFTGSAGTGKSVLLRAIINSLRSKYEDDEVAVTASTGIAALNIGGTTLHKFTHTGFGNKSVQDYLNIILKNRSYRRDWIRVKVLIIDEISMIGGRFLDKLEEIARRVRQNTKAFGGIQLVLCGDFFQLPPVEREEDVILAFQARCWERLINKNIVLKTCFRQKDEEFARMLNEIRLGFVSEETEAKFKSLCREPKTNGGIIPAELYPLRSQVEAANNERLSRLGGKEYHYLATDRGNSQLLESCIAPHSLTLKVGAQVILIRNLEQTLVNGSIGIVTGFKTEGGRHYPIVKFNDRREITIHEATWDFDIPRQLPTSRTQIPLLLAWALSIHKSQGQTIEYVKIDLDKTFEAGQAYVALSRAICMENLQVLNFRNELVRAHASVTEFYKRINIDE